jgi:hypothetical protein
MYLRTKYTFTTTQAKVIKTGNMSELWRTYGKQRKVTYALKMLTAKLERKTRPKIEANIKVQY